MYVKKFWKNLSTNFVLIAVFVKLALKITKRTQYCGFTLIHTTFSCVSKSPKCTCVQRLLECIRSYTGHLKNEWVIRPFRKHPKSSKFVCIEFSLQCMHNLFHFYRNSKISWNSSYRFLWNFAQQETSIQKICSVKHLKRKCRTRLKFDSELKPLWRRYQATFILIAQKMIP